MMRKMLSMILIACLFFAVLLGVGSQGEWGLYTTRVCGVVSDSDDGMAKIYDDGNWSCANITVYYIITDDKIGEVCEGFAVDTADTDHGMDYEDADFAFDPEWTEEHNNCVAVGYAYAEGRNYMFITNFTYKYVVPVAGKPYYLGRGDPTEWEPIPTPIVYAKGDGWINITIPKFTNLANSKNVVGFAVYRNGLFIGNAISSNTTHYFYNDTNVSPTAGYYYSVAVIAKGNYTTYGKSPEENLQEGEPLQVTLNSPTGGEIWTGLSPYNVHSIKYTISGGSPPYGVVLSYSTAGGAEGTFTTIDEITHNEEVTDYSYDWSVPKNDSDKVTVRINVTDYADTPVSDSSGGIGNFIIIDSTAPEVDMTRCRPPPDGSVSINRPITIVFSEPMNDTSPYHVTHSAFSISGETYPDPGGWGWTWNDAGDEMTSTHNDFVFGENYTITITTAAKDLAGNYLVEDYSWNFTANMNVCLNSPIGGDVWTGGVAHGINYTILGGAPDYEVKIYYSYNGGDWSFIAFDNQTEEGTWEYLWEDCPSIDSETVNMKIVVVDYNETESIDTSGNFKIDSTAPWIITYSGNDTVITTIEHIMIVFSEEMNKTSVESAFSLKNASGSVTGSFSWDTSASKKYGTTMYFTAVLASGDYTAEINENAADRSVSGNHLTLFNWSFTAVRGKGDLFVHFDYPSLPEKGKTYQISVTVSNIGPEAENLSGFLTVKFYASRDTEFSEENLIYTGYISNVEENKSGSESTTFIFDDYGNYYFLVEITSTNPTDLFPDRENTYATSASVNIQEPTEEIGPGPYTLIALMVVIVVIVAALILLSLKKKGELTLKEKTKEEKEEEKKESEEEKNEE